MALFDSLGFSWDRDSIPRELPRASIERTTFRFSRMLPEYVWDAGVLEGNPFTFPEVKTLLDGVTVGGHKLCDQDHIVSIAHSSQYLLSLVRRREFGLDESTFRSLHALVAGDEEPRPARFSGVLSEGVAALQANVPNPLERAMAFFLFGSLQRFFDRWNERTSYLMMNGVLMSEGMDAISIPAMQAAEFNSKMKGFYDSRDATQIMRFALEYHPDFFRICELNPELSLGRRTQEIRIYRFDDPLPHSSRAP